jgi:hypothetical protein
VNCGLPAQSPIAQTLGCGRLQPVVELDVSAAVDFDADLIQPDSFRIGRPARARLVGGTAKADFSDEMESTMSQILVAIYTTR